MGIHREKLGPIVKLQKWHPILMTADSTPTHPGIATPVILCLKGGTPGLSVVFPYFLNCACGEKKPYVFTYPLQKEIGQT